MSKVLIIAEHDGSNLNPGSAKCVTCASALNADAIDILVLAADAENVASQAAGLSGVSRVLTLERPENADALAATFAPQIVAMAGEYTHVFGPSSTFGKDLMPRVAALLGVGQVSDIMSVEGPRSFKRPVYAGNAIITVTVPEAQTVVATVRTASYAAAKSGDDSASIESVSTDVELPDHTRYIGLESGSTDRPDLQTAPVVISGGRALGSSENFEIIFDLADALKAGVGASRAAVDAGYVPNDMQVGQTGKIIAPDLYIAIGISGAIQHITGIKDAGTIVAINKDAEAPIFEIADVGLVGDLFEIVPQLKAALSG